MIYKALYLSPMIPSYDVEKTSRFFVDILCFTSVMNGDNYSILIKDHLTVHLLKAGVDIGEMEFYLEVDELDTLWDKIKDNLPELKARPPFNRDYGMREFHIIIPHTKALLFVGQVIKE